MAQFVMEGNLRESYACEWMRYLRALKNNLSIGEVIIGQNGAPAPPTHKYIIIMNVNALKNNITFFLIK